MRSVGTCNSFATMFSIAFFTSCFFACLTSSSPRNANNVCGMPNALSVGRHFATAELGSCALTGATTINKSQTLSDSSAAKQLFGLINRKDTRCLCRELVAVRGVVQSLINPFTNSALSPHDPLSPPIVSTNSSKYALRSSIPCSSSLNANTATTRGVALVYRFSAIIASRFASRICFARIARACLFPIPCPTFIPALARAPNIAAVPASFVVLCLFHECLLWCLPELCFLFLCPCCDGPGMTTVSPTTVPTTTATFPPLARVRPPARARNARARVSFGRFVRSRRPAAAAVTGLPFHHAHALLVFQKATLWRFRRETPNPIMT